MEGTVTTIGIIAGVSGLFGYTLKLVLPRLLDKLDEKDEYIKDITTQFTNIQNHKTTEMTEALKTLVTSNERYATAVEAQTEVFRRLIEK